MPQDKSFSFESQIIRFEHNVWDLHFLVPEDAWEYFIKEKETRRVICTFNDTVVKHCALMPDGSGQYCINLNKEDRKQLKVGLGDSIHAIIKEDTSKYGYPIAPEMEELLFQDPEGSDFFHGLTIGKQRSLLHIIGKPKGSETRLKKALVVLDYLKGNQGILDFKELNQAFKDANNKFV
jgi:hypothetical protein